MSERLVNVDRDTPMMLLPDMREWVSEDHPDHDTICDFRADNGQAISEAFVGMGKLASRLGIVKLGTVGVDGTRLRRTRAITATTPRRPVRREIRRSRDRKRTPR